MADDPADMTTSEIQLSGPGDPVWCTLEAGIARVRFNRPDVLNAINVAMAEQFLAVVRRLHRSAGVRAVVLSGEGRAFMAGGDLQTFVSDPEHAHAAARALIDPLHEAIERLAQGEAPVLACVHGAVAGAGLSLMLGVDLAVAADDAIFNLAYARIGASVDAGGTWALPRLVGLRRAMEIALLCDGFDAQQALSWGLVNRVVPPGDLERETMALAVRLAQGPTAAHARTRRLLRESLQRDLAGQLDAERDAFAAGTRSRDFAEGLAAFFGKRAPNFSGG